MIPIGGKKAIPICILKILEDYSDYDHPLTQTDIIDKLKENYGIEAGRNAISRNISLLCELGYDISTPEESGHGAYLRERMFDDTELMVLMDSVLTSRFIPKGNARQMIEKLGKLSNRHFRQKMPHVLRIDQWHHQRNRAFFYNLELISDAIARKKQVAFTYNRLGADGKLHAVRPQKDTVSPFAIVCANGQYYLIACYIGYDDMRHVRVDRMTDLEILDEPARPIGDMPGCTGGLNIAQYASEHNFMYGGKAERIVLHMRRFCAGDVVDAFGAAASMKPLNEDTMEVVVHAAPEGMRFFALQFAPVCEVIEPAHLRETLRADIIDLAAKYGVSL